MATGGQIDVSCNLTYVGEQAIENPNLIPTGLVVSGDILMVTDWAAYNVQLYRCHDGKLLAKSEKLESWPCGICFINDKEICLTMGNCTLQIMSVQYTGSIGAITKGKTLHVNTIFDWCHAIVRCMDTVVVCGRKQRTICWCIVSINDGRVVSVHQICNGVWTYLTSKDSLIYISCDAGRDSPDTGVYGYNIQNPSEQTFTYKHNDLNQPCSITVDTNGFIFVCNYSPSCIHHLTDKYELLTIYREEIPSYPQDIFWDNGLLYITRWESNVITRFKPQYSYQQGHIIPAEILRMDEKSLKMYKEALQDGKEKVHNIRIMVVGQYGVGKSTLTKRLLGQQVDLSKTESTEGIGVYIHCCKVFLKTGKWVVQPKDSDQLFRLERLVRLLAGSDQEPEVSDEQHDNQSIVYSQSTAPEVDTKTNAYNSGLDTKHKVRSIPSKSTRLVEEIQKKNVECTAEQTVCDAIPSSEEISTKSEKAMIEIINLVKENADKLEMSKVDYATIGMWDFAGQYVFYTTHQTFLTHRAIYLLLTDLSQQLSGDVKDEFFFDMNGKVKCQVHDLVEVWLNSIHSCAPSQNAASTQAGSLMTPPVILVGTHADKIPEVSRQDKAKKYFTDLRKGLKDKPTRFHLVDKDFFIDNTQCDPCDPNLEALKMKIVELARKQSYWGEEVPARWLPLEQALMKLKASGIKVVQHSFVKELNQEGTIPLKAEELDLFLRFHHEMGTILYFSVAVLEEKIVLDPQWLIDALKSLITAEDFIVMKYPGIIDKWCEFQEKGILTHELIGAVWTQDKPEFHDNKTHILLLMEKLNVIARPMSYSENGKIKTEDYYLAPCMFRQAMPKEIISPELHGQMESTSVLCFVCTGKFLPPPVFHRLLGACLTHWPIAKQKSENLIYCGCCVFDLDLYHRLTLHFRDYVIFARVIRTGDTDIRQSSRVCSEARIFIFKNLNEIIRNLGQTLQFQMHIHCPDLDANTLGGLIDVSLLQKYKNVPCHFHAKSHILVSLEVLKFWFEKEEIDGQDRADIAFSVQPCMLHRKPSDRQLGRLSMKIGKEFFRLGLELGLSSADIEQLQEDNRFSACLMILVKWREKSGDSATFRNLEKAFINVGISIDITKTIITTDYGVSCLPKAMLDKQPEEKHMNLICSKIGKELIHLGIELGVPVVTIEQIRLNKPSNVQQQCIEIMTEWKQIQKKRATFKILEQAVKYVGIDPAFLRECFK